MFYESTVKTYIRVSPELFGEDLDTAILKQATKQFEGFISKDLGLVFGVSKLLDVGDGVIIPGDGAAYYESVLVLYTFKLELQEVVLGKITDIADFGVFIDLGVVDGMIHKSQTMDDFVTFSKSNVISGKESKKTLKVGDKCRARIIAVSYKDPTNPKIGLTMRQNSLGALQWIEEDLKKKKKDGTKTTKKKK